MGSGNDYNIDNFKNYVDITLKLVAYLLEFNFIEHGTLTMAQPKMLRAMRMLSLKLKKGDDTVIIKMVGGKSYAIK